MQPMHAKEIKEHQKLCRRKKEKYGCVCVYVRESEREREIGY